MMEDAQRGREREWMNFNEWTKALFLAASEGKIWMRWRYFSIKTLIRIAQWSLLALLFLDLILTQYEILMMENKIITLKISIMMMMVTSLSVSLCIHKSVIGYCRLWRCYPNIGNILYLLVSAHHYGLLCKSSSYLWSST